MKACTVFSKLKRRIGWPKFRSVVSLSIKHKCKKIETPLLPTPPLQRLEAILIRVEYPREVLYLKRGELLLKKFGNLKRCRILVKSKSSRSEFEKCS